MTKSSEDRLLEIMQMEMLDPVSIQKWSELIAIMDEWFREQNSGYETKEEYQFKSFKEKKETA